MPRQAFGQHFLSNQGIIQKILQALALSPGEGVLEIGPGRGALSFPLLKQISDPKKLLLIEKDPRMVAALQEHPDFQQEILLWRQDFLKTDWGEMIRVLGKRFSVVSNLPYESSVAIFLRLLQNLPPKAHMVLMFQKEVAARLQAKPQTKDYGSLSVYMQTLAKLKKVCDVSPASFRPPPQVESTVLKIKIDPQPEIKPSEREKFETLLKRGFKQRRKMLRQNLKEYAAGQAATVESWLQELDLNPQARAEELSPEQWVNLYKKIHHH